MEKKITYPLLDEEYSKRIVPTCPFCGSEKVKAGDCSMRLTGDESCVLMDRVCIGCSAYWTDTFHLTGYIQ